MNFAQMSNARLFCSFSFSASLFIALVGLTNEGDRGSKEQQISGDENGIRPYPLRVIPDVIQRSCCEISVTDEPRFVPLTL
jgi:hypothetical protein